MDEADEEEWGRVGRTAAFYASLLTSPAAAPPTNAAYSDLGSNSDPYAARGQDDLAIPSPSSLTPPCAKVRLNPKPRSLDPKP